jgi:hypothetical protein
LATASAAKSLRPPNAPRFRGSRVSSRRGARSHAAIGVVHGKQADAVVDTDELYDG